VAVRGGVVVVVIVVVGVGVVVALPAVKWQHRGPLIKNHIIMHQNRNFPPPPPPPLPPLLLYLGVVVGDGAHTTVLGGPDDGIGDRVWGVAVGTMGDTTGDLYVYMVSS